MDSPFDRAMLTSRCWSAGGKTMTGIEALQAVLKRMWARDQGGIICYEGDGEWGVTAHGLTATPEELTALFELAGLEPQAIEVLGRCEDCVHAVDGLERGYTDPCLGCLRPRHSLFEIRKDEGHGQP